jgi:hypothetical protein
VPLNCNTTAFQERHGASPLYSFVGVMHMQRTADLVRPSYHVESEDIPNFIVKFASGFYLARFVVEQRIILWPSKYHLLDCVAQPISSM